MNDEQYLAEDARDRRAALAFAQAFVYSNPQREQFDWPPLADEAYRWLRQRISLSGGSPDLPHWPGEQLDRIERTQEKIMSDISDLQAADAALDAEITTFLADVATALTNAAGDASAVEAVVADINAKVAQLQAADPVTGTSAASGDSSSDTPAS